MLAEVAARMYDELKAQGRAEHQWTGELKLILRLSSDRCKIQLLAAGKRQPGPAEKRELRQAFSVPGDATEKSENFEGTREVWKATWPRPRAVQMALLTTGDEIQPLDYYRKESGQ